MNSNHELISYIVTEFRSRGCDWVPQSIVHRVWRWSARVPEYVEHACRDYYRLNIAGISPESVAYRLLNLLLPLIIAIQMLFIQISILGIGSGVGLDYREIPQSLTLHQCSIERNCMICERSIVEQNMQLRNLLYSQWSDSWNRTLPPFHLWVPFILKFE